MRFNGVSNYAQTGPDARDRVRVPGLTSRQVAGPGPGPEDPGPAEIRQAPDLPNFSLNLIGLIPDERV